MAAPININISVNHYQNKDQEIKIDRMQNQKTICCDMSPKNDSKKGCLLTISDIRKAQNDRKPR